jgi:hypothetical protein
MPDKNWKKVLMDQIAQRSQAAVARELSLSAATISMIVNGKYPAGSDRIERLVRGRYMGAKVFCPAAGFEMGLHQCTEFQGRPFAATNPLRVQMYVTCPTCVNRIGGAADPLSPTENGPIDSAPHITP